MELLRFLAVLSLLVFVHEGGHFLLARLSGVKVEEFGFGIPPRIWGRKVGGTVYSINLLPIGGFVRLKGEDPSSGEYLGLGDSDSFWIKSKLKRVLIIAGGAFGNFMLAWLIWSSLLTAGTSELSGEVIISQVVPGGPAAEAGIKNGDIVGRFNNEDIRSSLELSELTDNNLGKEVLLAVKRGDELLFFKVVPRESPPAGEGPMGVIIQDGVREVRYAFWKAPFIAIKDVLGLLGVMYAGVGRLFGDLFLKAQVPQDVGGIVAIYALTSEVSSVGLDALFRFIAILSLNLIVVNLLPLPALDGGRILLVGVEAVRGKKLAPKTESLINQIGFAFLLLLILLLVASDIVRFY